MIGRILTIALNTFREAVRSRMIYGIVLVVVGANLFALALGEMSLNEEARIARDVGLGGVSLCGSLTAIILGVSLLYGEAQRKTLYTILSKPIERYEFVVGKYLGMTATLTLLTACFALALAGLLLLVRFTDVSEAARVGFDGAIVKALVLAHCEILLVAAVAVFFSSFSTPYLSGI
ncbi:MAG: ABC transporter permease subunit, partial [Pseudomonadota bacterium]